jgi:hypothetical protein
MHIHAGIKIISVLLQEKILDSLSDGIVTLELHGTVFFLSSTVVLGKILGHLNLPNADSMEQPPGPPASSDVELAPLLPPAKPRPPSYDYMHDPEGSSGGGSHSSTVQYLILDCERLQVCRLD